MRLSDYPYKKHEADLELHFDKNIKPYILSRKERNSAAVDRRLNDIYKLEGQELGETKEKLVQYIERAPITKNFAPELLSSFTGSKLKHAWYVQPGRIMSNEYQRSRDRAEYVLYDVGNKLSDDAIAKGSAYAAYGHGADSFDEGHARPNYGGVQLTGDIPLKGAAPGYGSGVFKFKEEVKTHITYTPYDSLDILTAGISEERFRRSIAIKDNLYPLLTQAPDKSLAYIMEASKNGGADKPLFPYFEWQSYTPLMLDKDISVMAGNFSGAMSPDVINAFHDFSRAHDVVWTDALPQVSQPNKKRFWQR